MQLENKNCTLTAVMSLNENLQSLYPIVLDAQVMSLDRIVAMECAQVSLAGVIATLFLQGAVNNAECGVYDTSKADLCMFS